MKLKLLFFLGFLPIVLTKCKSPSDQIKDAFTDVDKSLVVSNEGLNNSLKNIYSQINSNQSNNKYLASKADTIYLATSSVVYCLDSLKNVLIQKDSTGTNPNLATKLIVNSKIGNELTQKLLIFYHSIYSYSMDTSSKLTLDSTLQLFKEIQRDKAWAKKYFEATPTIAAVTILAKINNDCSNAAIIILNDINRRLKE